MSSANHEREYRLLADEILHFQYKPGEMLSENDLCQRFGLSRTPVRSLLQRLQENGLVQIISKRGTIVTRLNMDTITQLIYERVAVETMVLRDYINSCTPADVERIRYLNLQLRQATEGYPERAVDAQQFLQADLDMHSEWFRRMNLGLLWTRLSSPHSSYTRFCVLDILTGNNIPDVLEQHGQMLTLIENRDTAGIEPLLREHLYGGIRRLGPRIYTEFADFFEPFGGLEHANP